MQPSVLQPNIMRTSLIKKANQRTPISLNENKDENNDQNTDESRDMGVLFIRRLSNFDHTTGGIIHKAFLK